MPSKTSLPLRLSMPNTGKPSAGCDACRRMKVKCGEERPACARCRRVGRECRYRDPPSIFHPMNDSAKLSSEKPRRGQKRSLDIDTSASLLGQPDISKRSRSPLQWVAPPQSAAGPRSSASTSRAPSSASPRRHRPVSPAIEASLMSKDWEEAAISFYLSEFVIYPEENSQQPGYLEFLPDLLNEQPEATHLKEALKSVALSAMGNRSCMEQLSLQAQRSYGKALAEVSLALNDKTMQKADSTLVALILLGQYEIVSGDRPGHSLWTSHGEGQAALLLVRGEDQFLTERGRTLFRLAQSSIQRSTISGPSPRASWKGKVPDSLFPHEIGRQLHDINNRICETRAATAALLSESSWREDWYTQLHAIALTQSSIVDRIDALTERLGSKSMLWFWRAKAIGQSDPESLPPSDTPNAPFPRYAFIFTSLIIASHLFYFWAIRAKLLEGLLDSIKILQDALYTVPAPLDSKVLRTKLNQGIDDLCATLPYLFGELDTNGTLRPGGFGKSAIAYMALWPLHMLSGLRALEGPRRSWVLARLTQIGTVYGIRQALHLRDFRLRRGSLGTSASSARASVSAGPPTGANVAGVSGVSLAQNSALNVGLPATSDARDRGPLDSPREMWIPEM